MHGRGESTALGSESRGLGEPTKVDHLGVVAAHIPSFLRVSLRLSQTISRSNVKVILPGRASNFVDMFALFSPRLSPASWTCDMRPETAQLQDRIRPEEVRRKVRVIGQGLAKRKDLVERCASRVGAFRRRLRRPSEEYVSVACMRSDCRVPHNAGIRCCSVWGTVRMGRGSPGTPQTPAWDDPLGN